MMAEQAGGGAPVLGVDLGGTKILAGVVDAEHRILGRAKRPTPAKEGAEALSRAIAGAALDALADAGVKPDDLGGAGVGSPGPLDSERGVILFSANLAVRDYPLGPDLSRALGGRPVLVQNDVRVGGYGEFRLGAGRGYANLLAAFVGTGIGGCVIVDGKIVPGATGNAGEIGHLPLKPKGPRCGCGRRGCMEALASRTAIARRLRKAVRRGAGTVLGDKFRGKSERLKSGDLAAAYHAGDQLTVREVNRAAHFLGLGLGGLMNVLGPQIVIIGGGVAEALGEPYIDIVRSAAREQALADPEGLIKVVLAERGDDAGLLGASLLAREKFVTPPADS
jgi:glucokinase